MLLRQIFAKIIRKTEEKILKEPKQNIQHHPTDGVSNYLRPDDFLINLTHQK